MNASEMQDRFARIRARHNQPRHDRHRDMCDACFLVDVVRTAVARDWDPFSGIPYQGRVQAALGLAVVDVPAGQAQVGQMLLAAHLVTQAPPDVPAGWRVLAVVSAGGE